MLDLKQDDAVAADASALAARYQAVRDHTEWLAEPLQDEDQCLQSMVDASPVKWHRAHTTWFFERFVLTDGVAGRDPVDPQREYLFNSYYDAVGPRHARGQRGLISRPTVSEVGAWRSSIDAEMARLLAAGGIAPHCVDRIELGLQHEQQHQELLLSDLQHAFAAHPFPPTYRGGERWLGPALRQHAPQWLAFDGGLQSFGHAGVGFAFDNESPRHHRWLEPFELSSELVTEGEWLAFIEDGGYRQPRWWCADGYALVQAQDWQAPLYWRRDATQWSVSSLGGLRSLQAERPVSHVSWYEADAYARWAGARLPEEHEWEHAVERDDRCNQALDALWQWTGSAYRPYPGFAAASGALGEYNGKF
ncbi:MAG: ergothioneine biosynthesis protein EgtB, partial [Xanthomonadales bacterium]|nr:ergothioneine biosynthesis protein EgtB [Xanthomonadales bacterium]